MAKFICDFQCKFFKCNRCIKDGYEKMTRCKALSRNNTCQCMEESVNNDCRFCKNTTCEKRFALAQKKEEKSIEELPFEYQVARSSDQTEKANENIAIESKTKGFLDVEENVVVKSPEKENVKEAAISISETGFGKSIEHDFNALATAYVDGSYNQSTNTYGYGVVLMYKENQHTFKGAGQNKDTAKIRNVAGELLGAMTAIKKAKELGAKEIIICYDYEGIEKWPTHKWQAKNQYSQSYRDYVNNCGLKVRFKKVKAHSGECFNEMADSLAKKAVGV